MASGLDQFWKWWTGELNALVPGSLKRLSGPGKLTYFSLVGAELAAGEVKAGQFVAHARVPLDHPEPGVLKTRVREALSKLGKLGNGRPALLLDRQQVLVRRAELPLAAEENLRQVVEFELDRLSPFPAANAYFDCRTSHRDVEASVLHLDLAVAPRARIVAACEQLAQLGLTPVAVHALADQAAPEAKLDLLPPERRAKPKGSGVVALNWLLATLAAVLALAAVAYPIWVKREQDAELRSKMGRAKEAALQADRMSTQLTSKVTDFNYLLGRRQTQLTAVELVDELSKMLPNTIWLSTLDLKPAGKGASATLPTANGLPGSGRELQMNGEALPSAKLIELFEQSGLITNTTFKTPLRKSNTGSNLDQFHIAGDLKAKVAPDFVVEADLLAESAQASEPGATPAGGEQLKQPLDKSGMSVVDNSLKSGPGKVASPAKPALAGPAAPAASVNATGVSATPLPGAAPVLPVPVAAPGGPPASKPVGK